MEKPPFRDSANETGRGGVPQGQVATSDRRRSLSATKATPLSGLLKKSVKGRLAIVGTTLRGCPALRGCPSSGQARRPVPTVNNSMIGIPSLLAENFFNGPSMRENRRHSGNQCRPRREGLPGIHFDFSPGRAATTLLSRGVEMQNSENSPFVFVFDSAPLRPGLNTSKRGGKKAKAKMDSGFRRNDGALTALARHTSLIPSRRACAPYRGTRPFDTRLRRYSG